MTKQSEIEKERMREMFDNLNADKYPLKEYKYVGAKIPRRLDGLPKASGEAVYAMDMQLPGMLYMRFMTSPYPHAKILKMDTSKAEKLPGVRYILRYDDPELPETASLGLFPGLLRNATPLPGVAHFQGEPVGAAVAADTEAIAEEALSLIEVDWEERPFNLDVEKAAEPDAPLSDPEKYPDGNHWNRGIYDTMIKGDTQKGFAEAEKVIEFRMSRTANTWVWPERPCGIVKFDGDRLDVWIKIQHVHHPKRHIHEWFPDIPINKIQTYVPYQGATFGGFIGCDGYMGGLYNAVVVARRTRRPVKYIYSRRDDFYGGSQDEGVYYTKVGVKKDGTITAIDATMYGACTQWPVYHSALHFAENTRVPNITGQTKSIWINKGPTVPVRCELLSTCTTLTAVTNRVAAELGMDPTEIALKNDGFEGHDMAWLNEDKEKRGFDARDSLKECIDKGKAAFKWDQSWHKPGTRKLSNGRMHGVGFGWSHEWSDSSGGGAIAIRIERKDGTANLLGLGSNVGNDPDSTYCQIAADELGFRLEDVSCNPQIDPGVHRHNPGAATALSINGWAVRHAARILKQKILEAVTSPTAPSQRGSFKPAFPGYKPEDLDIQNSLIFVKDDPSKKMPISEYVKDDTLGNSPITSPEALGTRSAFTEPLYAIGYHAQEGGQNPHSPRPKLCRQAHFMEVEVDTETGEVFVTRVVNVNDVGKVINRMSCEGQQYGGTVMGVGRAKYEEVIHDPVTGVMLNGNLIDYKIATTLDTGPISTILVETGMGYGPYGSTGIGEDIGTVIPGLLAPAVYNAIGVWVEDFPITPDKVLKALGKI